MLPEIVLGDITRLAVDAIVNAANRSLLGGGGVDGAIHAAAGPALLAECRTLGGCATGEAKITGGHGLPARLVIHAVGPVWSGGGAGEPDLLRSCYERSIDLACDNGVETLAFSNVSTGIYGFPADRAAGIALAAVRQKARPPLRRVLFCCYSQDAVEAYRRAYRDAGLEATPVVRVADWR
jgi:O-acetyl-ADP-ribose deacetylase (regulator of RNase III)